MIASKTEEYHARRRPFVTQQYQEERQLTFRLHGAHGNQCLNSLALRELAS